MKTLRFSKTYYTLSSQLQPARTFSEKWIVPSYNLTTKASSISFDDSCQSQIDADEVKRKCAEEIVAIVKNDLTEDDSRMRMFWQPVVFPPDNQLSLSQ